MAVRVTVFLLLVVAATQLISLPSRAEGLAQPQGRVILTVSGNIEKTNNGDKADFDLAMLHALGVQPLSTTTSWTDGTLEFSGVLVRDVMAAVGARGKTVEAIALNDYTYAIEIEDFSRYPVILATKLNGKVLKVRNKGPLWIVYPLDRFTQTEKIDIERRMVWQLRHLNVK